jgi:hypothetical protein
MYTRNFSDLKFRPKTLYASLLPTPLAYGIPRIARRVQVTVPLLALRANNNIEGPSRCLHLTLPQFALDAAWPGLTFERVNAERASLVIGLFIQGTRDTEIPDVQARIRNGNLFRKLVAYAAAAAGPDNCIVDQERAACWLSNQSKPTLRELRKKFVVEQAAVLAQAEFGEAIKGQGELIAPHNQNLKAILQRHVQDRLMSLQLREMYDEYPPPV